MITYKNISFSAKTFYGVRFESGETKQVPGYINSPSMIRVFVPKNRSANYVVSTEEEPIISRRGRKKSVDPDKLTVAETNEIKINTSEEETSDGN